MGTLLLHALAVTAQAMGPLAGAETSTGDPIENLRACLTLPRDAREQCLEAASRRLVKGIDDGTIVVRPALTPQDARAQFGLARAAEAPRDKHPPRRVEPTVNRIDGLITSLAALPNGRWQFVLDGKSVWNTLEAGVVFSPMVGERVTINRGALGSLRAAFRGQSPLLVARRR